MKKFFLYSLYILVATIAVILLVQAVLVGYQMPWTGFGEYNNPNPNLIREKTFWDWMELLIIPIFLTSAAVVINFIEKNRERNAATERAELERSIATDRQQDAALQSYLDRMSELLIDKKLLDYRNEEARSIARTRTLTILPGLDEKRKGFVLRFLYEANLINKEDPIVDLKDAQFQQSHLERANLRGANLQGINLEQANLQGAILADANLENATLVLADLRGSNLSNANLHGANLARCNLTAANLQDARFDYANLLSSNFERANLEGVIFEDANLRGVKFLYAKVSMEQLEFAKSVRGAILPDGKKVEWDIKRRVNLRKYL